MHTVEEIEAAIEQLPRDEFFHLRDWMTSRFEDLSDEQIEDDIKAGRLDHLAQAALAEFGAGLATPFPVIEVSKCIYGLHPVCKVRTVDGEEERLRVYIRPLGEHRVALAMMGCARSGS